VSSSSGLLRPAAGRIVLDGEDVTAKAPHELVARGVCHIPEGRGIFRSMSVRENLLLQARARETDALGQAIDAFPRLGERLDQRAGTLSGGEQQMLAVARAYLSNPSFVFLDEVSLGLAPRIVDEIFTFLRRLSDRGASLLLVEQYVTRALRIADFVFILSQGEVAFAGEPSELDAAEVFRTYIGADVA